jgi:hypothetical protein
MGSFGNSDQFSRLVVGWLLLFQGNRNMGYLGYFYVETKSFEFRS